jgi:hypothetical protein
MNTIIAAALIIGGGDLIHQLIFLLVVGICLGLLYYLVTVAPFINEMFKKILGFIIILVGVLILINVLLGMVGHPLITTRD